MTFVTQKLLLGTQSPKLSRGIRVGRPLLASGMLVAIEAIFFLPFTMQASFIQAPFLDKVVKENDEVCPSTRKLPNALQCTSNFPTSFQGRNSILGSPETP
jgi:hypothetical protein